MFDFEREELEIEFNARYDYIAELRAEHQETKEQLDAEMEWYAQLAKEEADAFIGPVKPIAPRKFWNNPQPEDDEIPF